MPLCTPGFLLPLDNCRKTAKGFVNGFMVRKIFSHIGINDYDIRTLLVSLRIFAPYTSSEVVLLKHVWIILHFLHISMTKVIITALSGGENIYLKSFFPA